MRECSGPHYLNRPGPGVKACLAHGAHGPMGLISKHSVKRARRVEFCQLLVKMSV